MRIDWTAVATIAAPIIAFFVGVWWNRWREGRPVLVSHFGHVSSFTYTPPGGQSFQINTHAVVVRNVSHKPATNVRLHHHGTAPDFHIWPQVVHQVETLPAGSQDIVIPTLIPGKELVVSYLYFPPLTFSQINAGIDCDQGFARAIPVLLQRQYPRWLNTIRGLLVLVGLISVGYLLGRLVLRMLG